jgi:hypothetical protein
VLQVWPIQASIPLKSKGMLNTLNNTEMKRKLLMQQQTSTSSEPQLTEKQKKAEYAKQYRLKRKLLIQQQASTSSEVELRHLNDSVFSSLKMERIRLVFFSEL